MVKIWGEFASKNTCRKRNKLINSVSDRCKSKKPMIFCCSEILLLIFLLTPQQFVEGYSSKIVQFRELGVCAREEKVRWG